MLVQRLSGPAVKVPPPVLQEDGLINQEYFGVLAGEKGPYITNDPPEFPENYAGTRDTRTEQDRSLLLFLCLIKAR